MATNSQTQNVHEGVLDFRWNDTQLHVELRQDEAAQAFSFKFSGQTAAAGGDGWNVTADLTGPLAVDLGSTMLHGINSFSPDVFSEVASLLETFAGKAASNAAAHMAATAAGAMVDDTPASAPTVPADTVAPTPEAQLPTDVAPAAPAPTAQAPAEAASTAHVSADPPAATTPAEPASATAGVPAELTQAACATADDKKPQMYSVTGG